MNVPTFIGVYDDMASSDYCERMIAKYEMLESTSTAHKGEDMHQGVRNRKDRSFMFNLDALDLAQETNAILDASLAKYMDDYPSLAMQRFYSNQVKVQKTSPKGGFHLWHCEQGYGVGSSLRTIAWMIYLNDVPDGEGETEFLEYGVKLTPTKGTVVFFPSSFTHTHRGNPVYSCDKYIATGWYYLND